MSPIGIQLGTEYCAVAAFSKGKAEAVAIDTPPADWAETGFDRVLPSVFALNGQEPIFGWAAKQAIDGMQVVKRLLATEETASIGGRSILIDEVVALMFAHMKRAAAEGGLDVDRAVVTIPANSKGPARFRTKVCAGLSGIEVLTLINEPTAAAMAFGLQATGEQTVLVYDFGGGTLDVTLLEAQDGMFFEQASKGIRKMGGLDFDKAIGRKILETIPDHESWSTAERTKFWLEVEKAKILLSSQEETNVQLPGGAFHRLTREAVASAIRPLFEQTRAPILLCLAEMKMASSSVDALVLVGTESKTPGVREFVSDVLGVDACQGADPTTAKAEGAAIAAAILTGELIGPDYFVTTEHALGTVIANPVTGALEFSQIIPRNQKLPARASVTMRPDVDYQESVELVLMEGDPAKPLSDPENVVIWNGEVRIPDPRPRDEITLEFTYEYTVDGVLSVTVMDLERELVLLDPMPITFGATRRSSKSGPGRTPSNNHQRQGEHNRESELRALLARAEAVLPYLVDAQARTIRELAEALKNESENAGDARDRLAAELRKYSYP